MPKIIVYIFSIFILILFLPLNSISQTYSDDSLAVRAILDSNGLDSIAVESVTDSSNGRITYFTTFNIVIFILPKEIGNLSKLEMLFLYYDKVNA